MASTLSRSTRHALLALPKYYIRGDQYDELINLIDRGDYLVYKAETLGIETLTADLENDIIPYCIEKKDWVHFVHYVALDLNLRGLGEQLSQELMLKALVLNKRIELGQHIIYPIADPLDRAAARAILLGTLERQPKIVSEDGYRSLRIQKEIEEDLMAAAKEQDRDFASKWASCLAKILEYIDIDLAYPIIQPYLSILNNQHGDEFDRFWLTFAGALKNGPESHQKLFWESLQQVSSQDLLLRALPILLSREHELDLIGTVEHLRELQTGMNHFIDVFLVLADLLPRNATVDIWDAWIAATKDIVDLRLESVAPRYLSRFLSRLTSEQVQVLIAGSSSLETKLAISVAVSSGTDPGSLQQVMKWIGSLDDDTARLHWLLRLLERQDVEAGQVLSWIKKLGLCITFDFYRQVDAVHFLDALSRYEPKSLPVYFDLLVFSQATTPGTLIYLAQNCRECAVLHLFVKNIEKYVCEAGALAGYDEADKFKLRRELLLLLLFHACRLKSKIDQEIILNDKLFEAELDEIYPVIVRLIEGGLIQEAMGLANYLHSPKYRFLVSLQVIAKGKSDDSSTINELLSLEHLYGIFADLSPVADVILGCEIALDHPAEAITVSANKVNAISEHRIKAETLFKLAEQNLTYQQSATNFSKIRFQDVNNLCMQAANWLPSHRELSNYAPRLIRMCTEEKTQSSIDELLEGTKQIMALTETPYHQKIDLTLKMLSHLRSLFRSDLRGNPFRQLDAARKIRELFNNLFFLSQKTEDSYLKQQLEQSWTLLYPLFIVILKEPGSRTLIEMADHAWQADLAYDQMAIVTQITKSNNFFYLLVRLEDRFPVLMGKTNHSPWRYFSGYAQEKLPEAQARVVVFSRDWLVSDQNLPDFAAFHDIPSDDLLGFAFLYAISNPLMLPLFLQCIPGSELKDVVITRMVLDGWLPDHYFGVLSAALLSQIHDVELAGFLTYWQDTHSAVRLANLSEERRSLEARTLHYATRSREKWFFLDIVEMLPGIYQSKMLDLGKFADQTLAILRHSSEVIGTASLQQWLQYYLSFQSPTKHSSVTRYRVSAIKKGAQHARHLKPPQIGSDSGVTASTLSSSKTLGKFKTWRNALQRRWDQHNSVAEGVGFIAFIIMLLYSILLLFFDLFFINQEAVQHYLDLQPWYGFWIGLLFIYTGNIWFIGSVQRLRKREKPTFKPVVDWLILIFSGIPLWGGFVFPLTMWFQRLRPAWILASSSPVRRDPPHSRLGVTVQAVSLRAGNVLWRKGWFWWGLMVNIVATFLAGYYFLDAYIPLGAPYQQFGKGLTMGLHMLVFFNAIGVFWWESIKSELTGWRLWRNYMFALLWLVPLPGMSMLALIIYMFAAPGDARENTVLYQVFGKLGTITREPLWSELKEKLEKEIRNMAWLRGIREPAYHEASIIQPLEESVPIQFLLRVRAVLAAGASFWLVWGLFQIGIGIETIERIMYFLLFISIGSGISGLLVWIFQFLLALKKRTSYLPDPPYAVYFYITQLAIFSGGILSYGVATDDTRVIAILGFIGMLFLGVKFIEIILDTWINIPKSRQKAKFEDLFWILLLVTMFSLALNLDNNGAVADSNSLIEAINTNEFKFLLLEFLFKVSFPLTSFALAILLYPRFMAPFGFRHFFNRSLPPKTRLALAFVGITFLIPLGEIWMPLWAYCKESYWIEFEKQLKP